jgi:hypothetical protein
MAGNHIGKSKSMLLWGTDKGLNVGKRQPADNLTDPRITSFPGLS